MSHRIPAPPMEIEIETRCAAGAPGTTADAELDALAGDGGPRGWSLEVVDDARLRSERRRRCEDEKRKDSHPFTLPAMTPWM